MGIIAWIVFGLVAGAVAKLVFPGKQPGGIVVTVLLGIAGALAGGFTAAALGVGGVDGFNLSSFIVAVIGALVLLFVYELLAGRDTVRT
jgi:uncharacterized membrane protein YeaQ/YmgE (transglycosylase-associated protein family)